MVYGVNPGSAESHRHFSKLNSFPFPLLVDTENKLAKKWGLPRPMLGLLPPRVTCIIDKTGVLRGVIKSSFKPEFHAKEALRILQKINAQ